jgi:SAM-dependent methyltransferase
VNRVPAAALFYIAVLPAVRALSERLLKGMLKKLVARLMRPGLVELDRRVDESSRLGADAVTRLDRLEQRLSEDRWSALERQCSQIAGSLEALTGATIERDKHREELAYWRWLFKTEQGRSSLYAPPEEAFAHWQRERFLDLGRALGLHAEADVDAWATEQSAVEIGAGPYPALAAAPRWKRAVAVDPIARGYVEEGILPPTAGHITYIEAPGERIPLPAEFADLVVIENALDHVSDPAAVLKEIYRLLRPDGLLWLLVDLSDYSDPMHPHPFNEARIRSLLADGGFEVATDRVSDHKSHPKAYGEYRGLLRKPAHAPDPVELVVRPATPARA